MLLSIIRQNQKLAAKRNPAFDRNRFAKFLIYFMVAFWAAYLIFIGVMLSFAFEVTRDQALSAYAGKKE